MDTPLQAHTLFVGAVCALSASSHAHLPFHDRRPRYKAHSITVYGCKAKLQVSEGRMSMDAPSLQVHTLFIERCVPLARHGVLTRPFYERQPRRSSWGSFSCGST